MSSVISEDMAYSQNHDLFEKENAEKAFSRKESMKRLESQIKEEQSYNEQRIKYLLDQFPTGSIISIKPDGLKFDDSPSNFVKADYGKNMLSLIEPRFIVDLGKVLTFGAQKYAPNNWQKCEDTSRYKDALLRHIFAYLGGEEVDPETGIPHLSHATCNLMFLHYFENQKKG